MKQPVNEILNNVRKVGKNYYEENGQIEKQHKMRDRNAEKNGVHQGSAPNPVSYRFVQNRNADRYAEND